VLVRVWVGVGVCAWVWVWVRECVCVCVGGRNVVSEADGYYSSAEQNRAEQSSEAQEFELAVKAFANQPQLINT
jgi:hypothetical protein